MALGSHTESAQGSTAPHSLIRNCCFCDSSHDACLRSRPRPIRQPPRHSSKVVGASSQDYSLEWASRRLQGGRLSPRIHHLFSLHCSKVVGPPAGPQLNLNESHRTLMDFGRVARIGKTIAIRSVVTIVPAGMGLFRRFEGTGRPTVPIASIGQNFICDIELVAGRFAKN